IQQFIETGRIKLLEELESQLPRGLPDLLRIQNLGPKKIAQMHKELGVGGVDDLKKAISSGALAELSGFGAQSVRKIAEGIAFVEKSSGRTPIGLALPIAQQIGDSIGAFDGVKRIEMAGSLRRGAETIGDIDLLCECDDGERIVTAFTELPAVHRVLAAGSTRGSVTVLVDRDRELQIDLRVVPAESFGAALQYFTGSKEHNVRLREIAVKKKWRLNEYGLFAGEKRLAGATEESIYGKLEVPFAPPELREDRGEFDMADTSPLVTENDIQGDLHVHTVASDGVCTIEEMAEAAKARGYKYIAITDHSKSSIIANGLSAERMIKHIEDVRAADARVKGITILAGTECDILADGSLDYPDSILAQCDMVIASIHAGMTGGKTSPTRRLLKAIENRYVTMIGHATGRLINRRPAMDINMADIVGAAAETRTILEINAAWQRLDLKADHVRQAVDAGVMLAINTDSHHSEGLDCIGLGVLTARRGWATAESILNTKPLKSLRAWIGRKRA
ncbi:MAG: DNA polymerase/3'-5' exonuclease PolX, partial [Phycisphaerae bacterium]